MTRLTLAQAKRLLEYKRRTRRAPRAYDDTTTQAGLKRLIKAVRRQSRIPAWLRRLVRM